MRREVIFLLLGLLFLGVGVYATFFLTRGFVATTAVIERVELVPGTMTYKPYVRYSMDGSIYHAWSDVSSSSYREGKRIKIFYNPANPEEIHGSAGFVGVAAMAAGAVCMAAGSAGLFKERRRGTANREERRYGEREKAR